MNDKAIMDLFELHDLSEEEREEFLEQAGGLVMKAIFRKAWIQLDSEKRDELAKLLEKSDADPDNEKKSDAVLQFLDEHVENIQEYAKAEVEKLLSTYRQVRDAMEDEVA